MATHAPLSPDGLLLDPPDARAQIAGLIFALLLIDPAGRIVQVNHATEDLLGVSAKRLIGTPLFEMVAPLDPRVSHRMELADAALVARDVFVRLGESERQINLTLSPLAGHPGWRVVTISHTSAEEMPNVLHDEGAARTPSILAHEIKNPLAAIKGAAQLAARKLPLADKKLARMITDEVDRIARLIDRMQQLGSQMREKPVPCNLHEAVRAAIATVRAADARALRITEEFDPSLPPVLANRDALEQVLINLISNARDAACAGASEPGLVTIRTRYVSGLVFSAMRLGRAVRLPIEVTVSDNGPGIDPSVRDRLFEPFVTSKQNGQGLGLALVQKLMRDMDGSISHERDVRQGLTHFRLHLPVVK